VNLVDPGRIPNESGSGMDPDPAGSNVTGSGSDPAGSEVGSGKYWPDSIFSLQEITRDNTELYTKTH